MRPSIVRACGGPHARRAQQNAGAIDSIPGARFVPLESRNHLILEEEPAWMRFRAEVLDFLGP